MLHSKCNCGCKCCCESFEEVALYGQVGGDIYDTFVDTQSYEADKQKYEFIISRLYRLEQYTRLFLVRRQQPSGLIVNVSTVGMPSDMDLKDATEITLTVSLPSPL